MPPSQIYLKTKTALKNIMVKWGRPLDYNYPWSYRKLDNYNSTKDSLLSTNMSEGSTLWNIRSWAYLDNQWKQVVGKERGSLRGSPELATILADTVAGEILGCSAHAWHLRGAEQHSGLSEMCTLWQNPVTGVEIQMYGRWDLAGAIARKRAKLQRSESASYLSLPIEVKPGRSS